jgi:hypothetical protein
VGAGQVANLDYGASEIYLMETEVLSPMRTIGPGQSTSFTIEWGACRCPGPILDVSAAGCVAAPLKAQKVGGFCRLTGQFGVFDQGELHLVWRDDEGDVLHIEPCGGVNPLTAVLLDRVAPLPQGTAAVECQVTTAGRQTHLLASTTLE